MAEKARRFAILLDRRYPVENEVIRTLQQANSRAGAAFLRAIMLLGFNKMKMEKTEGEHGTGTT